IELTALDLGTPGKDNTYGAGRIDCCAAINAVTVGIEESAKLITRGTKFALLQNLPNPFHTFTTIHYSLSTKGKVTLRIYDITGRLVRTLVNGEKGAGSHVVLWNGRDEQKREVTSGVYFYRLEVGERRATKKLIHLR
ncbi:S8 family peptidase, partial [candidate division TA06 bacterium]|nr:S8 family peptidase [candidate division TA06 bacterium]